MIFTRTMGTVTIESSNLFFYSKYKCETIVVNDWSRFRAVLRWAKGVNGSGRILRNLENQLRVFL